MRILFLAQCYAPEDVSAAVLITELAVDLACRGHAVTMVTGAPNYPAGRVFPGYRNAAYQVEWLDGVRVIRTWSYISPRKAFWPRLLHYGSYSATAFYGGLLAPSADIVMSYSPPLTLGVTAWLLSRIRRIPWVLEIEDIYPDAAVAAGVLRNRRAIQFFGRLEHFLYRRATHISVIAENFRQNLLQKGVPAAKVTLIPVWADPDLIRPQAKENEFRRQHGLTDKFVVMYAGNLGLTSCLEDMVAAAALLRDEANIRFVLIGEGVKKDAMVETARKAGLDNLLFLPYQPRARFGEVLAAADVGVATLNPRSALSSLPSKIFNVMASGRPLLAIAPATSELASVVRAAECGLSVAPDRPQDIAAAIRVMAMQPAWLAQMGRNARAHLESNYARAQCVNRFERLFAHLTAQNACRQGSGSSFGKKARKEDRDETCSGVWRWRLYRRAPGQAVEAGGVLGARRRRESA